MTDPISVLEAVYPSRYSICIRQAEGFCCIQYTVCPDVATQGINAQNGMTIGANAIAMALSDDECTEDYIGITGEYVVDLCLVEYVNQVTPLPDLHCRFFRRLQSEWSSG